jgi:hypothetical protein
MISVRPLSFVSFNHMLLVLHSLNIFRSATPLHTRKNFISSLILPIFDYCLYVCCNINNDSIARLQVAMNNCVRYIFNVKRRAHITPYNVKLGWLKICERRDLQIATMTHKILHGYGPSYLNNLFTDMRDIHSRATRAQHARMMCTCRHLCREKECTHDHFL